MRTSLAGGVLVLFCGAVAFVACRRESAPAPPPAPPASPSAEVEARLAAPSASAAAEEAPDAARTLTKAERRDFERFRDAVADGRKATREKRWADAEAAFTKALRARPADARTRAERGYARLLGDELDEAAQDFERALAGGVDAKLGGQVFYNVGLLREKRKQPESARAAFAISNALAPSAAAKAKLGAKSSCTADVDELPIFGEDLRAVNDFDALAKAIGPEKQLGSPKASVCVRTHTATGDPTDVDVCSGEPPWVLNHHHLHFTENVFFVVPKKPAPGLLYYEARVGSWPAHCTNMPSPTATLAGDFLRVTSTFDGTLAALDEEHESDDEWQLPCTDVLGYTEETFYETKSGKRVLRIYMLPTAGIPAPKVTTDGRTVTLTGAGCDRTLTLRPR